MGIAERLVNLMELSNILPQAWQEQLLLWFFPFFVCRIDMSFDNGATY